MTREQFENLKIGDKVRHSFGGIGIVTAKDGGTYTLKDKGFDGGDGCDEVSFAWNEGEPVRKENIRNYVEVYEALRKAVPPTASMLYKSVGTLTYTQMGAYIEIYKNNRL